MKIELIAELGEDLKDCIIKAHRVSIILQMKVFFEFNGELIFINEKSDLDIVYYKYNNIILKKDM
jgi:hypothetical protein